ncbi:carboxypeptidase regulatory-like domain-containing protein [Thiomonas sp. X19]|uniref:carboxypeptidase regulatory-like domain-containing protein n=1 Tax=Thiomonas sp. X19 TaxID=1050370 RepID=UPI0011BFAB8B|nr:carboxypeptidase regulatory-like domain-containing protein [Thiomonas sp. X19]
MPNLRGAVIDSVTKAPIAGAVVDVYGRDGVAEHVITDSRGFFALKGEIHDWGAAGT